MAGLPTLGWEILEDFRDGTRGGRGLGGEGLQWGCDAMKLTLKSIFFSSKGTDSVIWKPVVKSRPHIETGNANLWGTLVDFFFGRYCIHLSRELEMASVQSLQPTCNMWCQLSYHSSASHGESLQLFSYCLTLN